VRLHVSIPHQHTVHVLRCVQVVLYGTTFDCLGCNRRSRARSTSSQKPVDGSFSSSAQGDERCTRPVWPRADSGRVKLAQRDRAHMLAARVLTRLVTSCCCSF
jgi:hypothetical protein